MINDYSVCRGFALKRVTINFNNKKLQNIEIYRSKYKLDKGIGENILK